MQEEKSTIVGFSERFSALINGCGLTQKELSVVLMMSDTAIINYKRGRVPKADELLRIAKYFNVSIEWLLTGEDNNGKMTPSAWEIRCRTAETKLKIAIEALKGTIKQISEPQ